MHHTRSSTTTKKPKKCRNTHQNRHYSTKRIAGHYHSTSSSGVQQSLSFKTQSVRKSSPYHQKRRFAKKIAQSDLPKGMSRKGHEAFLADLGTMREYLPERVFASIPSYREMSPLLLRSTESTTSTSGEVIEDRSHNIKSTWSLQNVSRYSLPNPFVEQSPHAPKPLLQLAPADPSPLVLATHTPISLLSTIEQSISSLPTPVGLFIDHFVLDPFIFRLNPPPIPDQIAVLNDFFDRRVTAQLSASSPSSTNQPKLSLENFGAVLNTSVSKTTSDDELGLTNSLTDQFFKQHQRNSLTSTLFPRPRDLLVTNRLGNAPLAATISNTTIAPKLQPLADSLRSSNPVLLYSTAVQSDSTYPIYNIQGNAPIPDWMNFSSVASIVPMTSASRITFNNPLPILYNPSHTLPYAEPSFSSISRYCTAAALVTLHGQSIGETGLPLSNNEREHFDALIRHPGFIQLAQIDSIKSIPEWNTPKQLFHLIHKTALRSTARYVTDNTFDSKPPLIQLGTQTQLSQQLVLTPYNQTKLALYHTLHPYLSYENIVRLAMIHQNEFHPRPVETAHTLSTPLIPYMEYNLHLHRQLESYRYALQKQQIANYLVQNPQQMSTFVTTASAHVSAQINHLKQTMDTNDTLLAPLEAELASISSINSSDLHNLPDSLLQFIPSNFHFNHDDIRQELSRHISQLDTNQLGGYSINQSHVDIQNDVVLYPIQQFISPSARPVGLQHFLHSHDIHDESHIGSRFNYNPLASAGSHLPSIASTQQNVDPNVFKHQHNIIASNYLPLDAIVKEQKLVRQHLQAIPSQNQDERLSTKSSVPIVKDTDPLWTGKEFNIQAVINKVDDDLFVPAFTRKMHQYHRQFPLALQHEVVPHAKHCHDAMSAATATNNPKTTDANNGQVPSSKYTAPRRQYVQHLNTDKTTLLQWASVSKSKTPIFSDSIFAQNTTDRLLVPSELLAAQALRTLDQVLVDMTPPKPSVLSHIDTLVRQSYIVHRAIDLALHHAAKARLPSLPDEIQSDVEDMSSGIKNDPNQAETNSAIDKLVPLLSQRFIDLLDSELAAYPPLEQKQTEPSSDSNDENENSLLLFRISMIIHRLSATSQVFSRFLQPLLSPDQQQDNNWSDMFQSVRSMQYHYRVPLFQDTKLSFITEVAFDLEDFDNKFDRLESHFKSWTDHPNQAVNLEDNASSLSNNRLLPGLSTAMTGETKTVALPKDSVFTPIENVAGTPAWANKRQIENRLAEINQKFDPLSMISNISLQNRASQLFHDHLQRDENDLTLSPLDLVRSAPLFVSIKAVDFYHPSVVYFNAVAQVDTPATLQYNGLPAQFITSLLHKMQHPSSASAPHPTNNYLEQDTSTVMKIVDDVLLQIDDQSSVLPHSTRFLLDNDVLKIHSAPTSL